MSKFDEQLEPSKAVDASVITDSATPWKERIVSWMINQNEAAKTPHQILEATDDKYDPKGTEKKYHFPARKHCLDSQMTYIRQDYDIRTKQLEGDKIVLLGQVRDGKLVPFKNAVKYLK